jgi:hypothetical protein
MDIREYRVRPVTRYVVTEYCDVSMGDGLRKCGSRVLGEFDNSAAANEVAEALSCRTGGVIVETEDRDR